MARKSRSPGRWWSRFHFVLRFLGLTGLVAFGAGVAVAFVNNLLDWPRLLNPDYVLPAVQGQSGTLIEQIAVCLLVGGALAAALALLVELLGFLFSLTGRRSALGFNVV